MPRPGLCREIKTKDLGSSPNVASGAHVYVIVRHSPEIGSELFQECEQFIIGSKAFRSSFHGIGLSQLRRRFGSTLRVSAFRWDVKEDRTTYRAFLSAVQEQLPEYEMPILADLDLAFRMHYASYGLIGYTMKIIRGAARIACSHPRRQITLRTLSQSYADHVWSERLNYPNPFGEKFDCEKAPPIALPSATACIPSGTLVSRAVRLELHA